MTPQTPAFDPSKPFTVAPAAPPPTFDPSKPFEAKPAAKAPTTEDMIARALGGSALQNTPFAALADEHPDLVSAVGHSMIGMFKGAGHTVESLGNLVHKIPGVSAAIDAIARTPGLSQAAFKEADRVTTPTNTAQRVGFGAEQAAELLIPGSKVSQAGEAVARTVAPRLALVSRAAVEAGGNAAMSVAQGGDARSALTAGVVGAAAPVVGAAVSAAVPALKDSAEQLIVKGLGPTKERFKAMAEKLAPQILARSRSGEIGLGLGKSREGLQAVAEAMHEEIGPQIDQAIARYGQRTVGTQPVVDALESAKDAFRSVKTMTPAEAIAAGFAARTSKQVATGVLDASGNPVMKTVTGLSLTKGATLDAAGNVVKEAVFEPRAVAQLGQLQKIITDLGPDTTVEELVAVRRAWDKVVAQAGGFAQRAPGAIGVPLKDASEAWAKREATSVIRQELDRAAPELSKLNKQFTFWKSLDDVLSQTLQRTAPQGPGLARTVAEGAGQMVGGATGSAGGPAGAGAGAILGGKIGKAMQAVFNSPRWQFIKADAKDALASTIASGKWDLAAYQLERIAAVEGLRTSPAGGGVR